MASTFGDNVNIKSEPHNNLLNEEIGRNKSFINSLNNCVGLDIVGTTKLGILHSDLTVCNYSFNQAKKEEIKSNYIRNIWITISL